MKKWQFNLKVLFVLAVFITGMMVSYASATTDFCFSAELRDGSSEVCTTVFENPKGWSSGATILAVHGLTETAATWGPLANEMFSVPFWGRTVKRVIALDLPGHGKSVMPANLAGGPFGELIIDDNISVILQTILALQAKGMGPRVIMGHSMGGLAIQGLQEALLDADLSLAYLGIFRAVLLAPVPAASSVWTQGESSDITNYIFYNDAYGYYVYFPDYIQLYYGGSYNTLDGSVVPNAPSLEEITAYNGPEPLYTILQLAGEFPLPRPDAREGAFSILNGTLLNVVSFSQDTLVPADDLDDLYDYLTGSPLALFYRKITADDACHSMMISNPARVAKELATMGPF